MTRTETTATDALSMTLERARAALYLLDNLCQEVSVGYSSAVSCEDIDGKDAYARLMRDNAMNISIAVNDVLTAVIADAERALGI